MARDDGTVTTPQLQALSRYLQVAGWTLADDDTRTSMWRPQAPTQGKKLQIVLPATQDVEDWPERAWEALQTLAYAERRLPEEIAEDITYGGADNVAVRLTPNTPSGQAPLPLASSAVSALHSYVVASASALEIPDLVLPSHRPSWAESYAGKVRLGASSGSFVLSLALPLVAEIDSASDKNDSRALFEVPPQPLGRRVSNRMLTAAQSARRLADEVASGHVEVSSFGEMVVVRAAANASEIAALKALGGPQTGAYQIRFVQSPLAGNRGKPVTLQITSDQQRILGAAADFLRTRRPRSDVTVRGLVVRLYRSRALGPGEIVIEGFDEYSDALRRWRTELSEADYNEAVRAHQSGLQVSITGDREEHGTHLQLRRISSFFVIPGFDYDTDETPTAPSPQQLRRLSSRIGPSEAGESLYSLSERTVNEISDEDRGLLPEEFEDPSAELDLLSLTNRRFGQLVLYMLTRLGYEVDTQAHPHAADFVMHHWDEGQLRTVIVEVKRWRRPVGQEAVRRLQGALEETEARSALLITTGSFTMTAEQVVQHAPISLIGGAELLRLLAEVGIRATIQFDSDQVLYGPGD